jgi:integrase
MARGKSRRVKTPNGAGSVILRSDGRWMARYSTTDPETGMPARKALYGRTEQEARAKLIQALADHGRGQLPFTRGRAPTLQQYAERWLARVRVRVKTKLRYEELLRYHVLPSLGRIQLARLEPQHVEGLLRAKRSAGLAARTCNHIRDTLRACLSDAMREGLVTRNVAGLARRLRVDDARQSVVLTPQQIQDLLRASERHRDGPLWVVALATGARESVLLGVRWSTPEDPRGDVDLEAKTVRISRTLQRTPLAFRDEHGDWLEQATKTRRSTRTVPLAEIACEYLRRQRAQQAEDRLRAGPKWTDDHGDLVFRKADGRPLTGAHRASNLQRALGMPTIRFHDLRHATRRSWLCRRCQSRSLWLCWVMPMPAPRWRSTPGWLPTWRARLRTRWTGSWATSGKWPGPLPRSRSAEKVG